MIIELPTPCDDAMMHDFLASRAIPGVEAVRPIAGGWRYSRTLADGVLVIEIRSGKAHVDGPERLAHRLLDLDLTAAPAVVDQALRAHPELARLVQARPGLRIPGAADPVELAFRAVLGQQISVASASSMAGRIAATYGTRVTGAPDGLQYRFPTAHALAQVPIDELVMTRSRARTIHELAVAIDSGRLRPDADRPPEDVRHELRAVHGIGPWTAGYVTMRACHDRDVLLADDLIVRRAAKALGLPDDARALARHGERFTPWRSYVTMHLWAAYRP